MPEERVLSLHTVCRPSRMQIVFFVIDKGGILEQGSPAELMEKKGAYYKLYMAQFAELG